MTTTREIIVYSTQMCPYCHLAKQLLRSKNLDFKEILVDEDPKLREEMVARTGRMSVPQIVIGSLHVGGYDDLCEFNRAGHLDKI